MQSAFWGIIIETELPLVEDADMAAVRDLRQAISGSARRSAGGEREPICVLGVINRAAAEPSLVPQLEEDSLATRSISTRLLSPTGSGSATPTTAVCSTSTRRAPEPVAGARWNGAVTAPRNEPPGAPSAGDASHDAKTKETAQ